MADYYTPTVVQQTIPTSAMSPLERLLLTNMFSADVVDDKYYFHAADGPETTITLEWSDLEAAIAASEDQPSSYFADNPGATRPSRTRSDRRRS